MIVLALGHGAPVASQQIPLGVYAPTEDATWSSVARFGQEAGQPVRYVEDYLGPGQSFPVTLGAEAAAHGAEPVLQLEPTMSMPDVLAGDDDAYLARLAGQVRAYHHPVILSWAPEANGNWYPYGYQATPASVYRASWAHVIERFKDVPNVRWMDIINRTYPGDAPTAGYVVAGVAMYGIDAYYEWPGATFASTFGPTLAQIREVSSKPVMISETGIGQVNGQAQSFPGLIAGIRADHLAGLIYFNQSQGDGVYHQRWALTPAGGTALREALR
jgi:hypothetical protein